MFIIVATVPASLFFLIMFCNLLLYPVLSFYVEFFVLLDQMSPILKWSKWHMNVVSNISACSDVYIAAWTVILFCQYCVLVSSSSGMAMALINGCEFSCKHPSSEMGHSDMCLPPIWLSVLLQVVCHEMDCKIINSNIQAWLMAGTTTWCTVTVCND